MTQDTLCLTYVVCFNRSYVTLRDTVYSYAIAPDGNSFDVRPDATVVTPEPATAALMALAVACLFLWRRYAHS